MTRRALLSTLPALALAARNASAASTPVILPIHHVLDRNAKCQANHVRNFWDAIWPQAAGDLGHCGMSIQLNSIEGEVARPPSRQPVITGLKSGALNLVVTDRIPVQWDQGRGIAGLTTLYRGYHLCMVALTYAHAHRIPFVATNTVTHELLHALLLDIFENRPDGFWGQARELRVDTLATRLWLLNDGSAVRESAMSYVRRLESNVLVPS
ncbi:MAG: hypothetical protein ABI972_25945 [Acidobacteriota bacterium]